MREQKDIRQLLAGYFRDNRLFIGMGIISLLVFSLVCFLYRMPEAVIAYAFLLSLFFWGIAVVLGFYRYNKKYQNVCSLAEQFTCEMREAGEVDGLIESGYEQLLKRYVKEQEKKDNETLTRQQEWKDYVMLWTHQIKTPITAMGLLLQIEQTEEAKELEEELLEIQGYVDSLLQYTRLDHTGADLNLGNGALEDLVNAAVRYHSKAFIRKKLALQIHDLDVSVTTDDKWMIFVLKQILSNSLKYTQQGEIEIYSRQQKEDQTKLELVIRDTGCGIIAEDLPRIFEKAYTGYNGHQDRRATGIGLFLVKKILDMLQHEIVVTSQPGEGTQVVICFDQWQ